MRTVRKLSKRNKNRFKVPKSVQQAIPIERIYNDGIFMVEHYKYSKCYKFSDINYAVASKEDKEEMFLAYSEILNSFDSGATSKITVLNRKLNRIDFEKTMMIPKVGDNLDEYRDEYNKMLLEKSTGANGIIQEKYLTITVDKKNVDEARAYFTRVSSELITHFGELGSKCIELDTKERLRLLHSFYIGNCETKF